MKLSNDHLDQLDKMVSEYRVELLALFEDCGRDEDQFGRVLRRYLQGAGLGV